jgi:hypothetical protein
MKSYEVKLTCVAKSKVHATVMVDAENEIEAGAKALEAKVEWSQSIGEPITFDSPSVESVEAIVDLDDA